LQLAGTEPGEGRADALDTDLVVKVRDPTVLKGCVVAVRMAEAEPGDGSDLAGVTSLVGDDADCLTDDDRGTVRPADRVASRVHSRVHAASPSGAWALSQRTRRAYATAVSSEGASPRSNR
jgi:hypothetical protein